MPYRISDGSRLCTVEETPHRVRDACVSSLPDPPCRQRRRQFRLTVLPRQGGHRIVIVRHMPERRAPDAIGKFHDPVARVGRAGFDDMRIGMDIAIAWRAYAAAIDDQADVATPARA